MYTDLNSSQGQGDNQHSHTMRNILVPMLVVVVLIIVGLFLSGKVSVNSASQGAAARSSVGNGPGPFDPGAPSSPARIVSFQSGTVGAPCIIATFDDDTGYMIDMVIGTENSSYGCDEFVADPNAGPITKTYTVFGSRITSKQYAILQTYLASQKLLPAGYKTNKSDAKTRSALKIFQGANGLSKTGTLNTKTKAKLNEILSAQMKSVMRVDNSQTTDQEGPVQPNPYKDGDSVCLQAFGYCMAGCQLAFPDQVRDCQADCTAAYNSCILGGGGKVGTSSEVKPI